MCSGVGRLTVSTTASMALGLVACAAIYGVDAPEHDPSRSGVSGLDGSIVSGGDGGDTAGACKDTTVDEQGGVFVVPGGSTTSACGPRATPCGSIALAIQHAAAQATVYIGGGTYTESIVLRAGLTLEGGWRVTNGAWTRACEDPSAAAVIQAPIDANKTVIAENIGGRASLIALIVRSKDAASVGESIYGVFAASDGSLATALTLNDVTIELAAGGRGATGKMGGAGGVAAAKCTTPGDGSTPPEPALGGPGSGATFARDGFHATQGASGDKGATGHSGAAGAAGPCVPAAQGCYAACTDGSGNCASIAAPTRCSTPGYPGCGGPGGDPGEGGFGGGASIPLYVWGASAVVFGGTFKAGDGGQGGVGGAGGAGAVGADGTQGEPVSCIAKCGTDAQGNCTQTGTSTAPGGTGGPKGGTGARGAGGGPGAGGASCSIFVADSAGSGATVDGTRLLFGNGGQGGGAGAGAGQAATQCRP